MVNPKKQHFTCSNQRDMSRHPCHACLMELHSSFNLCSLARLYPNNGLAKAQAPASGPQRAEGKACATDQACACAALPVAGSSLG